MSAFKVGQRVKAIAAANVLPGFANRQGTFLGYEKCEHLFCSICDCAVRFDGDDSEKRWGASYTLAPLTDPKADAFIATVKSWGPLEEKPTYADLIDSVLAYIRGGSQ